MITDFSDANKVILPMARSTDLTFLFQGKLANGSTFVADQYNLVCEGRLAIGRADPNFIFGVSSVLNSDGVPSIQLDFPKEVITNAIRENVVYWRVLASDKVYGHTLVLKYGELWLK